MGRAPANRDFQGVSDAERSLLEGLWELGPLTPQALQAALAGRGTERAYTTVQTLLHRLLRKGFVARRAEGASQVYSVALTREEFLARHVTDLADRLCEGALSPLVVSLVKTRRLSPKDLARLREIVAEAEPPARKKPRKR